MTPPDACGPRPVPFLPVSVLRHRAGPEPKSPAMAEQGIPLIGPILNRIIGTRNERFVKKYTQRVAAINGLEPGVRSMTDAQLRGMLAEFRDRIKKGERS